MVASRQRRLDGVDRARRVGDAQTRLVQHEVVNVGGEGGPTHRAVGPIGVAPQGDRSSRAGGDFVDDGGDVREVPLDGVAGAVIGGAEAAAIHREGGDVVAELGDERFERGVVGDRTVDQYQGWSVPFGPHGERGSVGGPDVERARPGAGCRGAPRHVPVQRVSSMSVVAMCVSSGRVLAMTVRFRDSVEQSGVRPIPGGSGRQQSVFHGEQRRPGPSRHSGLDVDVLDVVADGLRRDAELGGRPACWLIHGRSDATPRPPGR